VQYQFHRTRLFRKSGFLGGGPRRATTQNWRLVCQVRKTTKITEIAKSEFNFTEENG
jgi:hypothetical protein